MGRAVSKLSRTLGLSGPNAPFSGLNIFGGADAQPEEPPVHQWDTTIDQLFGDVPVIPPPSGSADDFDLAGLEDENVLNNRGLRRQPQRGPQQPRRRKRRKQRPLQSNISPNIPRRLAGPPQRRKRRHGQSARAQPGSFNIEKRQIYLPGMNNNRVVMPRIAAASATNNNSFRRRRPLRRSLRSIDRRGIMRPSPRSAVIPQRLGDLLRCPVCLNEYVDPHLLPCGHTYCYSCLNQLIQNNNILICPECRKEHIVPPEGFPSNFLVRNLIEENLHSTSAKCTECETFTVLRPCRHCGFMLCDRCYQRHKDPKLAHRKWNGGISQSSITDPFPKRVALTQLNRRLLSMKDEKTIRLFVAVRKLLPGASQVKRLTVDIPITNFLEEPSINLVQIIAKREGLGKLDQLILEYGDKRIHFNRTLNSYGIEDGGLLYLYNPDDRLSYLYENGDEARVVPQDRRKRSTMNITRNNVELLSHHSLNDDNYQTSKTSTINSNSNMSDREHLYNRTTHVHSPPTLATSRTSLPTYSGMSTLSNTSE